MSRMLYPSSFFSRFLVLVAKGGEWEGGTIFSSPWMFVCTLVICITYVLVTLCAAPHRSMDVGGAPSLNSICEFLASYANLRIQFSIHIFRGSLYTHGSKILVTFQYFVSSNCVVINHQKWGDCKCNQALIVGFGDNDHMIRGLMRFIEMISR